MATGHREEADDVVVEVDRRIATQGNHRQTGDIDGGKGKVGPHPAVDFGVADDDRPVLQGGVSADVIAIAVGVDDNPDRTSSPIDATTPTLPLQSS
jgi:hypothetical protein